MQFVADLGRTKIVALAPFGEVLLVLRENAPPLALRGGRLIQLTV